MEFHAVSDRWQRNVCAMKFGVLRIAFAVLVLRPAVCRREPEAKCGQLCQTETALALRRLRNVTGGTTWTSLPPWDAVPGGCINGAGDTMPDFCCWEHVYCCCVSSDQCAGCRVKYAVHALFIKDNNLTGQLADVLPALRTLSRWGLQELSLEGNALSGPVPNELGEFTNLTRLALGSNRLTGTLPPGLGNLFRLTSLGLDQNLISGTIPPQLCGRASAITDLNLRGNALTGHVRLANCTRLINLDVQDNSCYGPIPASAGWGQMHVLRLSNNRFDSIPEDFYLMTSMLILDANNNSIAGALSSNISNLELLTNVYLESNSISGTLPRELFQLKRLSFIYLGFNNLRGTLPTNVGQCSGIVTLNLRNNSAMTGPLPPSMGALRWPAIMDFVKTGMRGCDKDGDAPGHLDCLPWFLAYDTSHMIPPIQSLPVRGGDVVVGENTPIKCPTIVTRANASSALPASTQWLITPEYTNYRHCACDPAYTEQWVVEGPYSSLVCQPASSASSLAPIVVPLTMVPLAALLLACLRVFLRKGGCYGLRRFKERAERRMAGAPQEGLVSVVVTDIQGYSELMQLMPEEATLALRLHNDALRKAKWDNCGSTREQEGDSFTLVFHDALDAAAFCLQAQQLLMRVEWPAALRRDPAGLHGRRAGGSRLLADVRTFIGRTAHSIISRRGSGASPSPSRGPPAAGSGDASMTYGSAASRRWGPGSVRRTTTDASGATGSATSASEPSAAAGGHSAAARSDAGAGTTGVPHAWRALPHHGKASSCGGSFTHHAPSQSSPPLLSRNASGTAGGSGAGHHTASHLRPSTTGGLLHAAWQATSAATIGQLSPPLSATPGSSFTEAAPAEPAAAAEGAAALQLVGARLRVASDASISSLGGGSLNADGAGVSYQSASGGGGGGIVGEARFQVQLTPLPLHPALHVQGLLAQPSSDDPALFNGLRVRMGIATGRLERGQDVKAAPVWQRARCVSDAACGGQVLVDCATWSVVKERLSELGAVDAGGLNYKRLGWRLKAAPLAWLALNRLWHGGCPEALVLDMGCYTATSGGSDGPASPKDASAVAAAAAGAAAVVVDSNSGRAAGTASKSAVAVAAAAAARIAEASGADRGAAGACVAPLRMQSDDTMRRPPLAQRDQHQGGGAGGGGVDARAARVQVYVDGAGSAGGAAPTHTPPGAHAGGHTSSPPRAPTAPSADATSVGSTLQLYQLLPASLAGRAKVFGNRLALGAQWSCVSPPYFTAPGAQQASLLPRSAARAPPPSSGAAASDDGASLSGVMRPLLPPVTAVFTRVDLGSAGWRPRDARAAHVLVSGAMRALLGVVACGYQAREQEGELRYMTVFAAPHAALEWCLLLQQAALRLPWPDSLLQGRAGRPEVGAAGALLFRGPRLRQGVAEGTPTSILPDHLGRADYHGDAINMAARYMEVAAHGGQVVTDVELVQTVFQVWHARHAAQPRAAAAEHTPSPAARSPVAELRSHTPRSGGSASSSPDVFLDALQPPCGNGGCPRGRLPLSRDSLPPFELGEVLTAPRGTDSPGGATGGSACSSDDDEPSFSSVRSWPAAPDGDGEQGAAAAALVERAAAHASLHARADHPATGGWAPATGLSSPLPLAVTEAVPWRGPVGGQVDEGWALVRREVIAHHLGTFTFKGAAAPVAMASVTLAPLGERTFPDEPPRSIKGRRVHVASGLLDSCWLGVPDIGDQYPQPPVAGAALPKEFPGHAGFVQRVMSVSRVGGERGAMVHSRAGVSKTDGQDAAVASEALA